jgi:hypothetical protein
MSAAVPFERRRFEAPTKGEIIMSEFMYLFRGGEVSGSPEQTQQQMQKWGVWIKQLGDNGTFKSGQPLERTGKLVKGKPKTVTDGPYAESKDLVGGFLLVEAKDLAHAVELSSGCPILETGGLVEVRPVMKMNM